VAGKVKTWVWVVVAIAVVCGLGIVALAAAGFYFVSRHLDTQAMTAVAAAAEFDAARARFAGQVPLIELDRRGDVVRAHTDRPAPVEAARPTHLHLLAFDPSDEQIVRFRLPFWLLKLRSAEHRIEVNGKRLRLEDLQLTADDLERLGPSLVLDHTNTKGERVLVWSQ